jgi:hypothetical protein
LNSSNQHIAQFHNFCHLKGSRPRKFGLDMDVRWNSTYLMLNHLLPYKEIFCTFIGDNYGLVNGEPLLGEGHLSGILPGYSCKEGGRVEDGLLLEFPCTPTRTRSV